MKRLFCVKCRRFNKPILRTDLATGKESVYYTDDKMDAKMVRDNMNDGIDLYYVSRGPDHKDTLYTGGPKTHYGSKGHKQG
jgi:hypothetical protein